MGWLQSRNGPLWFAVRAFYRSQLSFEYRDLVENYPHSLDIASHCKTATVRVDAAEKLCAIIKR